MPVEPIILESFALESRRLCVAPPGRRSRLRCSVDLPPQRRTVSRPCLSWRAKGPDSSTLLPIAWSMMPSETEGGEGEASRMPSETEGGEGEARRARIGTFRSSQGPLYREDCENTPLVNHIPLDEWLARARLLRRMCSDRRTKLPRLGRSESDLSASESPRRSLRPFASAQSGYTSRPSESCRVLAPHIIWWPQARLICTAPPSPVAGATPRETMTQKRGHDEAEFGAAPARCLFRVLDVSTVHKKLSEFCSSSMFGMSKTNGSKESVVS